MFCEHKDTYGKCKIDIDKDGTWTISSWHVKEEYQNAGHGKRLLAETVMELLSQGYEPTKIRYIWDGQNKYVYKWLKQFKAKSMVNLNVVKYSPDDDWESHIYDLDMELFLRYCEEVNVA